MNDFVSQADFATLVAWGFSPFDFLVDGINENERTLFATHLGIKAKNELSFEVDSKNPLHNPHIVKHDTVQPTECDCEFYIHKMRGWFDNGGVPPKVCAHFKRASLVLLRREARERSEQEQKRRENAPLNAKGKTFNLLK